MTFPSVAGKTFGSTADYTSARFWYSSAANNQPYAGTGVQSGTVTIWGVQLEVGSVATPLARRDIADELALCQRFYQVGSISLQGDARVAGTTWAQALMLPVQMRAVPTVTASWSNSNISSPLIGSFADRTTIQYFGNATAIGQFVFAGTFTATADL